MRYEIPVLTGTMLIAFFLGSGTTGAAAAAQRQPPNVDCNAPARQGGPQRYPCYDILGVRFGMSAQEARAALSRSERRYVFSQRERPQALPDGTNVPIVEIEAKARLDAYQARDRLSVYLTGLPGQEEVFAIERGLVPLDNERPPLREIEDQIQQKYGPPTRRYPAHPIWAERVLSRQDTPLNKNDPLYNDCNTSHFNIGARGHYTNITPPPCGTYITYTLTQDVSSSNNIRNVSVMIVDHERMQALARARIQHMKANPGPSRRIGL